MEPDRIARTLASLGPHEIQDALRFVTLMERSGSMSTEEADAWRWGIAGRAALFHIGDGLIN